MNITQNQELKQRIIDLARMKATGKPRNLADRLNISERNLYRLVKCLKEEETGIYYSDIYQSYVL